MPQRVPVGADRIGDLPDHGWRQLRVRHVQHCGHVALQRAILRGRRDANDLEVQGVAAAERPGSALDFHVAANRILVREVSPCEQLADDCRARRAGAIALVDVASCQ